MPALHAAWSLSMGLGRNDDIMQLPMPNVTTYRGRLTMAWCGPTPGVQSHGQETAAMV